MKTNWKNIINHICGRASTQDLQAQERWLNCSDENLEMFSELKHVYSNYDPEIPDFKVREEDVLKKIKTDSSFEKINLNSKPKVLYRVAQIAALITVLICSTWFAQSYFKKQNEEYITYETGEKERKVYTLPDGSKLWLKENSTVSYHRNFGKSHRRIKIRGAAYMRMETELKNPIIIQTNSGEVICENAAFYFVSGSEKEEFVVENGKLSYCYQLNDQDIQVDFYAQDKGTFVPKAQFLFKEKNPDPNYLAWKTREIEFHNTPLIIAVKTLEDIYQVPVNVKCRELKYELINFDALNPTLKDVIRQIKKQTHSNVQYSNDRFEISKPNC